jgi:ABC-type sugar transport system ATPase subunit
MDPPVAGPILEMQRISKLFGPVPAIEDIAFDVLPGEVHAILGENGAGKSTLVKIICGQFEPSEGQLLFDGKVVETFTPHHARKLGVAMVQQELSVFDHLTVAENLFPDHRFARRGGWISRRRLYSAAAAACAQLNFVIDVRRPVSTLTPGQKQLVEILRCVNANPRVLILDEPTSGLNSREGEALVRLLKMLRAQGVSILYISHRIPEVLALSDRITILRDGRKRVTLANRDLSEDALVALMVGRDLTGLRGKFDDTFEGAKSPALEVKGLRGPGQRRDVSLSVRRGEIVGVFGLEGSGTFELSEMLVGLLPHRTGIIEVQGRHLSNWTPRKLSDLGVAFLHSNRKEAGIYLNLDVSENAAAPRLSDLTRWGLLDRVALGAIVKESIRSFGIKAQPRDQRARNLSGGNQQKLMLSLALKKAPVCFVVNEPTRGVDVGSKAEIHRLLRSLASNGGSILLFSSELPELISLAGAILVMRDGKLLSRLEGEEISEERVMAYAAGTRIDG